jgi:site-specific recombinase XerD
MYRRSRGATWPIFAPALLHSTVISSAEREAAYVIDGLMHNDVVQSDIHSTDTHGYSEVIFASTYLKNGGTLEMAASMAGHASTRTTQLYDRRRDEMSLDEVERIVI